MGRFILWTIVLAFILGVASRYEILPTWLNGWVCHLPGDISIKSKKWILQLPVVSVGLINIVFFTVKSILFKKK
jgi:hypothetical protein